MNIPVLSVPKVGASQDASKAVVLAVPIGAIVASFLIMALVIWPKVNDILELRGDNALLAQRANALESKAKILSTLNESKLEDQLASAEQILPSDKNVFGILRQIEIAAQLSGVLLNKTEVVAGTINTGPAPGAGGTVPVSPGGVQQPVPANPPIANTPAGVGQQLGAPSVQLRLSLTSDYQSLLRFLSSLYSFSRIVNVDSVNVAASVGESVQLSTSFSVDAYWKQLPSNLGSVENPIQTLTAQEEELLSKVQDPNVIQTPEVPEVPLGRQDLFSPF